MPKAQKILNELNSIGTFLKRVDACASSPASAGIPTVAKEHGFAPRYQGRDISVLASADGKSIAYGQQDGSWMLSDGQKTVVGLGSDQLQHELKRS